MLTLAIVGRPNVGKSTLFNRLAGKRLALVDSRPGVTRDRREGEGRLGPLAFRVFDTAGLEEGAPDSLAGRMAWQTDRALAEADALLFMIDARAGVTPADRHFARRLRREGRPVVLVANKAEARAADAGFWDAFQLGFGAPVPVSAEHGDGMGELYAALAPLAEKAAPGKRRGGREALRLAIVGRPNAGKSTLVNRLAGEQRTITGPEPGLTRDAVAFRWRFHGRAIELVDTAGIRRRARVVERLEKMAVADGIGALKLAHVVVVTIDATTLDRFRSFDRQDLAIADLVEREGRAVVVAVNKWDLVAERSEARRALELELAEALPQLDGVPLVTLSALAGRGVHRLMPAVVASFERWQKRIATPALNRWLEEATGAHPPPFARGGRVKLRYGVQTAARPPTFTLFGSRVDGLPESYRRYLARRLRRAFDLPGVPLRLRFKAGRNPYARA